MQNAKLGIENDQSIEEFKNNGSSASSIKINLRKSAIMKMFGLAL
jgi:hypothetical protein